MTCCRPLCCGSMLCLFFSQWSQLSSPCPLSAPMSMYPSITESIFGSAVFLFFQFTFLSLIFLPLSPRALSYSQDIKVIHTKDLTTGLLLSQNTITSFLLFTFVTTHSTFAVLSTCLYFLLSFRLCPSSFTHLCFCLWSHYSVPVFDRDTEMHRHSLSHTHTHTHTRRHCVCVWSKAGSQRVSSIFTLWSVALKWPLRPRTSMASGLLCLSPSFPRPSLSSPWPRLFSPFKLFSFPSTSKCALCVTFAFLLFWLYPSLALF